MADTKWEPFRDLLTIQDRMNRLFQEGLGRRIGHEERQVGPWSPPVDILESDDRIVLRADLPGVEQDDIELRVEDGVLILRGQRKPPADVRPEDLHRSERPHGTFVRSFSLPQNIDQAAIRASQKNGVLEVVLPKKQESKAKAIRIDVK
ncbi:MAG TPA: Hsp20/alpha crystallin family protein [Candidatus Dormibacteraeota bacterium]|nr:Hsp20/alpha crystallin family protein [Candidatus Dormibacteraeota bacterium]